MSPILCPCDQDDFQIVMSFEMQGQWGMTHGAPCMWQGLCDRSLASGMLGSYRKDLRIPHVLPCQVDADGRVTPQRHMLNRTEPPSARIPESHRSRAPLLGPVPSMVHLRFGSLAAAGMSARTQSPH